MTGLVASVGRLGSPRRAHGRTGGPAAGGAPGHEKPKDVAETLEFADLAVRTKQFAPSVRLYVAAFQAEPKLAEDMRAAIRYNAACAAALAGDFKGDDKPPLGEPEKARWRKQAIEWLKADLAHWNKQAEAGKPEAKGLVKQQLEHWKEDTDLASIRDEAAVKGLPEDEQKDCRASGRRRCLAQEG